MDIQYETVRMGFQVLDLLIDVNTTIERNLNDWSDIIPTSTLARMRLTFKLLDRHSSGWTTADADTAGMVSSWILNMCVALKSDSLIIAKRMTGIVKIEYEKKLIDKKRYLALRALHKNFCDVIEWLDGTCVWTYVPISKFNDKNLMLSF
jgi:hypothetical protein